MKRRKIIGIIMAAIISSSLLFGNVTNTYATDSSVQAKAIVNEMTIEQKIGQMLILDSGKWKAKIKSLISLQ